MPALLVAGGVRDLDGALQHPDVVGADALGRVRHAVPQFQQCSVLSNTSTWFVHIREMAGRILWSIGPPHQIRHVGERDELVAMCGRRQLSIRDIGIGYRDAVEIGRHELGQLCAGLAEFARRRGNLVMPDLPPIKTVIR